MSMAKQLYQLQEFDLEIESNERAMEQIVRQLGENRAVTQAQSRLKSAQQHLEECQHQQHSADWEIDDVVNKLNAAEEKLYSGRIKDPKELTNLEPSAGAFELALSVQSYCGLGGADQFPFDMGFD